MTAAPAPGSREARERLVAAATRLARRAVNELVTGGGGEVTTQLLPGDDPGTPAARDPAEGLRAARAIELAALAAARGYVRRARESGLTWHEVGAALGLTAAEEQYQTLADAAFDFAAGTGGRPYARTYGRSFAWRCLSCGGLVTDRGPCSGPAEDEQGHTSGCQRLAASVAQWDEEWPE